MATKPSPTPAASPARDATQVCDADVEAFLAHLQVERRMSAHTLDAYRRDLIALTQWAQGEGRAAAASSTRPARWKPELV